MYKNVLTDIPGIEYYPIVALLLFFGFFVALVVWFFRVDKTKLEEIARQPLEEGSAADGNHSKQSMSRS